MENRYLRNVGPSLWDGAKAPHHLGNVRAVVSDADSVEQVNHYYPFGILMGESRGGDVQRRKFGGKELDREWGLDLFDFEARRFDGMRFTQPDPLAEKYPDTSPYAFCLNTPLSYIDPTGMQPVYDANGKYLGSTKEGFTGQVYIYKGSDDIDFSKYTVSELSDIHSENHIDLFATMEDSKLSSNAKSNIYTDICGHFSGLNIGGNIFSLSKIKGGKITVNDKLDEKKANWNTRFVESNRVLPEITVAPTLNYEATVENIASSAIVHEWYSHGVLHYKDRDKTHIYSYKEVMKDVNFWPKTTPNYKKNVYIGIYNMYNRDFYGSSLINP